MPHKRPLLSNFTLKLVMAVTGVIFSLFVLVHMIGNLKVYQGAEHFNAYAVWLRTLLEPLFPYEGILWVLRIVLLACLVGHVGGAAILVARARKARGPFRRRRMPLRVVHHGTSPSASSCPPARVRLRRTSPLVGTSRDAGRRHPSSHPDSHPTPPVVSSHQEGPQLMTVGFIGTGNMANAIVRGMVGSGGFPAGDVVVFDRNASKRDLLGADLGVRVVGSAEDLVEVSDVVVVAVKPQGIPALLTGLADQVVDRRRVVVSIAAGTPLARLESLLETGSTPGSQTAVVRVMPNVNAMIGAGMSAVTGNAAATAEDLATVVEIFRAVGEVVEIPESQFSTYTAIAGSSPAFTYLFIDALSRAAVAGGMPKAQATQIAAQAVLGSAKMVRESEKSPWDLIDTVCSPGGTTVAGLLALEDRGFLSTVAHGVKATIDRDKEMNAGG